MYDERKGKERKGKEGKGREMKGKGIIQDWEHRILKCITKFGRHFGV
jgi:hypothetical protein